MHPLDYDECLAYLHGRTDYNKLFDFLERSNPMESIRLNLIDTFETIHITPWAVEILTDSLQPPYKFGGIVTHPDTGARSLRQWDDEGKVQVHSVRMTAYGEDAFDLRRKLHTVDISVWFNVYREAVKAHPKSQKELHFSELYQTKAKAISQSYSRAESSPSPLLYGRVNVAFKLREGQDIE